MAQQYNKPVPSPQGESDYYWEKAKQNELWLRQCNACGKAYFYPRDISPCCFSKDTSWTQASGKATLYTYGIVHRAPHPGPERRETDAPTGAPHDVQLHHRGLGKAQLQLALAGQVQRQQIALHRSPQ